VIKKNIYGLPLNFKQLVTLDKFSGLYFHYSFLKYIMFLLLKSYDRLSLFYKKNLVFFDLYRFSLSNEYQLPVIKINVFKKL